MVSADPTEENSSSDSSVDESDASKDVILESQRRLLRSVVRRVHPDRFAQSPEICEQNSEALKALNGYVDAMSSTGSTFSFGDSSFPRESHLVFWVSDGPNDMRAISVVLPAEGSLVPLYSAFGLLNEEQCAAMRRKEKRSRQRGRSLAEDERDADTEEHTLLEWLSTTIRDAVAAAESHRELQARVQELQDSIRKQLGVESASCASEGSPAAANLDEQRIRLLALECFLDAALNLNEQKRDMLRGLHVRVHLQDLTAAAAANAAAQMQETPLTASTPTTTTTDLQRQGAIVGRDGAVHLSAYSLVVDGSNYQAIVFSLESQMAGADLNRAQVLARLEAHWRLRAADLAPELAELLDMRSVVGEFLWETPGTGRDALAPLSLSIAGSWADAGGGPVRRFVVFARRLLDGGPNEEAFAALREKRRAELGPEASEKSELTMLVHEGGRGTPLIQRLPDSTVLQVRHDCPPGRLLAHLSETRYDDDGASSSVDEAGAREAAASREEEEAVLEAARAALGAEYVISVCPGEQRREVISAAQRLCEAAPQIRMAVNLAGASICLDDRYDAWGNGFISIPCDFDLGTVEGHLRALLPSSSTSKTAAAEGADSGVPSATRPQTQRRHCSVPKQPQRRRRRGLMTSSPSRGSRVSSLRVVL